MNFILFRLHPSHLCGVIRTTILSIILLPKTTTEMQTFNNESIIASVANIRYTFY